MVCPCAVLPFKEGLLSLTGFTENRPAYYSSNVHWAFCPAVSILKKIIILSYYFPPCNLTPSERIQSFAVYFHEMGYYPVIVTRNWDIPIRNSRDEHKKSGDRVIHEKNEQYEVYYLPSRPTLKSRLFEKYHGTRFYFLYLLASFLYGIGENFSSGFTSLQPLYRQCRKLLSENSDIRLMLVSGGPFHLFKFGYRLKKEFGIKWVADYRDDWNTNELVHISRFKIVLQKISAHTEKKWVGSAAFFISVSEHYVNKIHNLVNIPGYTILNGYLDGNYTGLQKTNTGQFTIAYAGSLYPNQPIHVFINAYKKFIDNFPDLKSKVIFVGLKAEPRSLETVQRLAKGYEKYFEYTERLPKQEAIAIQYNASVLLISSYSNLKGIPGSKLYEYVALKKPVLACPSDGDIIEATLKETGQGYFAQDETQCYQLLVKMFQEYGTEFSEAKNIDLRAIKKYSRHENAKNLAGLLKQIEQ
jgi:glycosyltransferase involved in cell wall biosynthesis